MPHKKSDLDGKFVQGWTDWWPWVEECAKAVVAGLRAIPNAPLDAYLNEV